MHEIKNLSNSPYDIETKNGSVRLPAFGTEKVSLADEMAAALKGLGMFEITKLPDTPKTPTLRTAARKK